MHEMQKVKSVAETAEECVIAEGLVRRKDQEQAPSRQLTDGRLSSLSLFEAGTPPTENDKEKTADVVTLVASLSSVS